MIPVAILVFLLYNFLKSCRFFYSEVKNRCADLPKQSAMPFYLIVFQIVWGGRTAPAEGGQTLTNRNYFIKRRKQL